MCQQPVVSTQSCSQQRVIDFQRSAQITSQILYGGRPAAQGAFVQLLGLLAKTPSAQPQTENGTCQHTGLLDHEEAVNVVQRITGVYVCMDECKFSKQVVLLEH